MDTQEKVFTFVSLLLATCFSMLAAMSHVGFSLPAILMGLFAISQPIGHLMEKSLACPT